MKQTVCHIFNELRGRRRVVKDHMEALDHWLDLVRAMWPECPAAMDTTGTGLWVDRAAAVLRAGGNDARI
jgi:hypothetical protein